MLSINFKTLIPLALFFVILISPSFVLAKTVSWSWSQNAAGFSPQGFPLSGKVLVDKFFYGPSDGESSATSFDDFEVSGDYRAYILDKKSNSTITDGSVLPVGTTFNYKNAVDRPFWYGVANYQDTPYGYLIEGAAAPSAGQMCSPENEVGQIYDPYSWLASFSQNPPVVSVSHTGSAKLLCNKDSTECVATSPGLVKTTFTFSQTYGRFYSDVSPCGNSHGAGAEPLYECSLYNSCFNGRPPYTMAYQCGACSPNLVSIPTQTITFDYEISAPVSQNKPPVMESVDVSGGPGPNQSFNFTLTGSDPDVGDKIRYGVDWDGSDGKDEVDEWVPTGSLVLQGTPADTSRSYPSSGTYKIKVLAEDEHFAKSAWMTKNVTVKAPLPVTATIDANPKTITKGETTTITWSSTNADNCIVSPEGWTGLSGTKNDSPSTTSTYTLLCTGPGGSDTDQVTVTVNEPPTGGSTSPTGSITVNGTTDNKNDGRNEETTIPSSLPSVTVSWSCSDSNKIEVLKDSVIWRSSNKSGNNNESVSDPISKSPILYTLECSKGGQKSTYGVRVSIIGVGCVPTTEICDGKDNNCNGKIDEGLSCPTGPTCNKNNICERTKGESYPSCSDCKSTIIETKAPRVNLWAWVLGVFGVR